MTVATLEGAPGIAVTDAGGVSPLNVCVVAHFAYPSLRGSGTYVGGVEYQTSLLARWLAGRGHRVTMVTWDEGQPDNDRIDGVRVIKLCREDEGWRFVRFVHPRWSSLIGGLRAADADLYYQNTAECVTGQVAIWCRARKRKFVYSVASNSDCDSRLPLITTRRERVLYRAGLRRADHVITQNALQQRMLRANFRRESTVIPLPCPDRSRVPSDCSRRTRVLWVGRVCRVKRPDRLLDLADRCRDVTFDLVGPSDGSPYSVAVLERARSCPNVRLHGNLTRERIADMLDEARCLCSTSEIEGFPNTFVEAWSHTVPVLSTFDPDDVIARNRAGFAVADPGALTDRLRVLLTDDPAWERAAQSARRYYLQNHTVDAVMPQFEALFSHVIGRPV